MKMSQPKQPTAVQVQRVQHALIAELREESKNALTSTERNRARRAADLIEELLAERILLIKRTLR